MNGVERYTYQTEAVRKVLRQFRGRVLLADEVGLGKTIEAGMVLREYLLRGMARRLLVLVPPALVSQWCEELESKFGLRPVAADGPLLRSDPAALPRGGAAVHRSFPYRFRASQPLYVAFALIHDPEGKALLSSAVPRARFLELQPLDRADFVTLSQRVFSLYQLAEENPGLGSELASMMGTVIDACHRRG